MRSRLTALALFAAPFCVQTALLMAFRHRGAHPMEACVDGMMASVPLMLFAAAYVSFGCRIGALEPADKEPLHGLCFACAVVAPFAMLGVFLSMGTVSVGSVLGLAFCLPHLAAAAAITTHAVSGMTGVGWKTTATALAVQSAAYAALIVSL